MYTACLQIQIHYEKHRSVVTSASISTSNREGHKHIYTEHQQNSTTVCSRATGTPTEAAMRQPHTQLSAQPSAQPHTQLHTQLSYTALSKALIHSSHTQLDTALSSHMSHSTTTSSCMALVRTLQPGHTPIQQMSLSFCSSRNECCRC